MPSVVSLEELRKWIDSKEIVLVDVREPFELSNGMIPTAHPIPLGQLPVALELPPSEFQKRFGFVKPSKSDRIVFYCRTGNRSTVATRMAQSKGFNAFNFAGSVLEWSKANPSVRFYGPMPVGR